MNDARGITRGHCLSCGESECGIFDPKPTGDNACNYCGCPPVKHQRLDEIQLGSQTVSENGSTSILLLNGNQKPDEVMELDGIVDQVELLEQHESLEPFSIVESDGILEPNTASAGISIIEVSRTPSIAGVSKVPRKLNFRKGVKIRTTNPTGSKPSDPLVSVTMRMTYKTTREG